MTLTARPYLKDIAIRADAHFDDTAYPFTIPAVQQLGTLEFHPDVTFLVGENGAGKSTILEAIALAMGFSPEGGTVNTRFSTTDSVSCLHQILKLGKSFRKPKDSYFLRAESMFNVATYMDTVGSMDPSLHRCSHGEAFMQILTQKLRGDGFYLLDEPEAALSPNRQLAALSVIHQLVQEESQFIIATHSPILLAYPHAKILLFDGSGISEIQYEDTEHFAVTRDFLNHYPRRLEQILASDE